MCCCAAGSGTFDEAGIRSCFIAFAAVVFGDMDMYVVENPDVPDLDGKPGLELQREEFAKTIKSPNVAALLSEALNASQLVYELALLGKQIQDGKAEPGTLRVWYRALSERIARQNEGGESSVFAWIVEAVKRNLTPDPTPPSPMVQPPRDQLSGVEALNTAALRSQMMDATSNNVRLPPGFRSQQQFVRAVRTL